MFSSVFMSFGIVMNLRLKELRKILDASCRRGDFQHPAKRRQKIFNLRFFLILGKIKGHMKRFSANKMIRESYKHFWGVSPPSQPWNSKASLTYVCIKMSIHNDLACHFHVLSSTILGNAEKPKY